MKKQETLATLGCLVLIIGFQGLLFVSMIVYNSLFYWLVKGHPSHAIIGGIMTYSIFVIAIVFLLYSLKSIMKGQTFNTAIRIASGVWLIMYPITPVFWYDNRYSITEPASGYIYGFEVPIYPLAVGIGSIILLLSVKENYLKRFFSRICFDTTSMILFSCLASATIVVGFLGFFLASELDYLEIRATPFTLVPNVVGLTLLAFTLIHYKYR